ncbi:hypothetical protein CISIN_1g043621mg [Citrus sinensis]|uniref:Uncharacterized protein n=1 Tax=Citrus sinensis TaxID=2711 RepID=A0A067H5W4_CITSI|nr:hypothetical protein CISIN_1g043621mg [Citrus sinensis]
MTSPPKPHQYSEYDKSGKPAKNHQPSNAELLSSAKLVADAAKDTLNSDHDKVDKTKVAHAAGDLLNAGSRYGNSKTNPSGGHKDSGGVYEDYLKIAEGLIRKH